MDMILQFLAEHNIHPISILFVIIGYLMPFPLAYVAYHFWHHYRVERFIMGIKWALLEIQVPREVNKTPAAMELIFSNAFYHRSGKGFWEQFIQGAPWMWFSLEMAGIDGKVHFYVRTPTRIRQLVETQIYAQYPQAKVTEVDDYTMHVPQYTKNGGWYMWGCEFKKDKEDFRPIKTYREIDEMKSGTEEEYKVDPITPTIEYLGSLPKGQQVWIQIIIRQCRKQYHSHHQKKHVDFYEAAHEFLDDMLKEFTQVKKGSGPGGSDAKEIRAPDYLKPIVENTVRNLEQIHFDCGIRHITLADKSLHSEDAFNSLRRSSRLVWRQYAAPSSNQIERVNSTQFDSPFSDPTGLALTKIKRRMLNFFRMRTFFHPPIQYSIKYPGIVKAFFPSHNPNIFVLSVEELATIYHFPGLVSETPSFKRIESKIAKPPSNLPS
jgi:hypothetical protein